MNKFSVEAWVNLSSAETERVYFFKDHAISSERKESAANYSLPY
tara:strand:- start:6474 stop:6605 length:132 start_codon:yes stop_codon:yes gene_type:complete